MKKGVAFRARQDELFERLEARGIAQECGEELVGLLPPQRVQP